MLKYTYNWMTHNNIEKYMKKKNIFIISGPSGAGEDSIMNGLDKIFQTDRVTTTTTRSMRTGESQGQPYYFISKEEFVEKIQKNEFFEYQLEDNGNFYGITTVEFQRVCDSNKVVLWRLEFEGVIKMKKLFPDAISILIDVPKDVIERRIRKRDNPSEDFIKARLEYADGWYKNKDKFDHAIKNEDGKLNEAIAAVADIIRNHMKS